MSVTKQLPVAYVVSRNPLAASYLMHVLKREKSIQVLLAENGSSLSVAGHWDPLYLIDLSGMDCPPGEYLKRLTNGQNSFRFIVIDHHVEFYRVCRLLAEGAQGILTYDQVSDSLMIAIHTVLKGGMWVAPEIMQRYLRLGKRKYGPLLPADDGTGLTVREEEILHMTRQRFSNKEIASKLDITVSTVKYHLSNIYSKMDVTSRSDLWRDVESTMHQPDLSMNSRNITTFHHHSRDLEIQKTRLRVG